MKQWQFCFLDDLYYKDFPDDKLMRNKEVINGISHNRPCFFAFPDRDKPEILWLVPVSSKYEKYKKIYDNKVAKYGRCNTIRFGSLLNTNAVFLIQNICPVTEKYIKEVYIDKNDVHVKIEDRIAKEVIQNAQEVLAIAKRGVQIVFPDIKTIYLELSKQLEQTKEINKPISKSSHPTLDALLADAQKKVEQQDTPSPCKAAVEKTNIFER